MIQPFRRALLLEALAVGLENFQDKFNPATVAFGDEEKQFMKELVLQINEDIAPDLMKLVKVHADKLRERASEIRKADGLSP